MAARQIMSTCCFIVSRCYGKIIRRELQYVDNGFATLFFHYGYVVGIVYICILIYMLYWLYKKQDGVGLVVLVTTIFITFIETTFIFNTSLLCNVALIVIMLCWHSNQEA